MSRSISATNLTEINAAHLHVVTLVHLAFDEPVFLHSGIGTIPYDSNDYIGVGQLGTISEARESEVLGPRPITLQLSGVDPNMIAEAQEAGRFKDDITIYEGYRNDDGTLVDDPWIVWKGWFEYAAISVGGEGVVSITAQHDLAILNEKDGGRFTDEDQQQRFSGDLGFEFITDMATVKLNWGGRTVGGGGAGGAGGPDPERGGPAPIQE